VRKRRGGASAGKRAGAGEGGEPGPDQDPSGGASVTLGGCDVAEDVVLAQLAVRLAVRFQDVAHDLPDGVGPAISMTFCSGPAETCAVHAWPWSA
jgi:hypothetical protein